MTILLARGCGVSTHSPKKDKSLSNCCLVLVVVFKMEQSKMIFHLWNHGNTLAPETEAWLYMKLNIKKRLRNRGGCEACVAPKSKTESLFCRLLTDSLTCSSFNVRRAIGGI